MPNEYRTGTGYTDVAPTVFSEHYYRTSSQIQSCGIYITEIYATVPALMIYGAC